MRVFFGCDLTSSAKISLSEWSDASLRFTAPGVSAVKPANYHITTFFIGNIEPAQLEDVVRACDEYIDNAQPPLHPFELTLCDIVSWQKPKIMAAIATEVPNMLNELHKISQKAAAVARHGITHKHATFRPHVTLYRKVKPENIIAPVTRPDITFEISQLHLFESVSGTSGVNYPIRFSWALPPAFSHRSS